MALSDWDCLALDEKGRPCVGALKSWTGGVLEIRKNWAAISDEKMWRPESGWTKPMISRIHEGRLFLAGFEITAARGPQNALFILAVSMKMTEDKKGRKRTFFRILAGIGCSGWDDNIPRLSKALEVDLTKWKIEGKGSSSGPDGDFFILTCSRIGRPKLPWKEFRIPEKGNRKLDSRFTGVTAFTWKEFRKWLRKAVKQVDVPENWLNLALKAKPLRYCQGDMWIGANLKMDCGSVTPIGKAEVPFLVSALAGNGKKRKKKHGT